mmetsp:Transcript_21369/g.23714  ORF Transcript_21369/g.23714 Transcript_21369/m.23714 type:complete len:238 (+) Transcript_21369:42-755(+)
MNSIIESILISFFLISILLTQYVVRSELISIVTNPDFYWGPTKSWTSIFGQDAYIVDQYASVGDTLLFQHTRVHDVQKMIDEEAFDTCDANSVIEEITRGDFCDGSSNKFCTTYTVTQEDEDAGEIYFACSGPKPDLNTVGNYQHCLNGQKIRVIVGDTKPDPACFASSLTLSCSWFGEDPSQRCDMVDNSDKLCPAECKREFELSCQWFAEDLSRCDMVENSSTLCKRQCGTDCPQ